MGGTDLAIPIACILCTICLCTCTRVLCTIPIVHNPTVFVHEFDVLGVDVREGEEGSERRAGTVSANRRGRLLDVGVPLYGTIT